MAVPGTFAMGFIRNLLRVLVLQVIPEALRAGVYRANSGSLAALRPTIPRRLGPCVGPPDFVTEWHMPHIAANVVLPFSISGLGPAAHAAGATTAAAIKKRRRYADMDS